MHKFHIIARALILKVNQVLLAHQKGADNTFLPGGHVEFSESAIGALKREIYEELGVDLVIEKFLGCVEADWEDAERSQNFEINLVFKAAINDIDLNSPLISREAHLEFFWSPVSDLRKHNLLPFPLQKLITDYMSGNQNTWWASTLT